MIRIFVDADGCPVVSAILQAAKKYGAEVTLVCDTSHEFHFQNAATVVVSKGADSADYALVNLVGKDDFVVTQDYGLAAMCLAKGAIPIHQDGMVYTEENINGLLEFRHTARKIRSGGGRLKGSGKRDRKTQDKLFVQTLEKLLKERLA